MKSANQTHRRVFLKTTGLTALGSVLGYPIVFGKYLPEGLQPILPDITGLPGKHTDLTVLNDRPVNAETPAHLLDDIFTPGDKLFVRNNGITPDLQKVDPASWSLRIEGESCLRPSGFTISELRSQFENVTLALTLECGGNGRAEFHPPAKGNQWTTGAVGCPKWTGVRLRDVLNAVGVKPDAVYIGYYGSDLHLSGQPGKPSISRGVPIEKALQPESLIAWALNGQDLPLLNGYPLRLVIGGWPASCSGKWLTRIAIRNRIHDGEKMGGQSYRVPCESVAPGTVVPDEKMCIIESMPVKSLITYPKSGVIVRRRQRFEIRGHAWAGDKDVRQMALSVDFGQTWQECNIDRPVNRHAWQRFEGSIALDEPGYYEVWARATDSSGISQPMLVPGWNPKGYLNNACHRIAVRVD